MKIHLSILRSRLLLSQRTNAYTLTPAGLRTPTTARLQSLPSGVEGVRATLNIMRRLTREFKKNIVIRELALSLVKNEKPKDWINEIRRLYEFVRDDIRYVRDIQGVETLATPLKTLEYAQGDCDDKAVLLAALLESIGHPTQFIALAFNQMGFSHVIVETRLGRQWIALETTEDVDLGWKPPNSTNSLKVQN